VLRLDHVGKLPSLQPVTMALPNLAARLIGERARSLYLVLCAHTSAVPAGIAAALFQASIYDVPGGYRAVMFDRFSGVKDKVNFRGTVLQPAHAYFCAYRLPRKAHISWSHGSNARFYTTAESSPACVHLRHGLTVVTMLTTVCAQNISTTTGSKDLQMVSITLRVLSRPDVDHLSKIYQGLGMDYDERVLPSIGNEVLKSIVAQFDAAELITQREVVRSASNRDFPHLC